MLNLFDYLTKEDNEKIEAYVKKYGKAFNYVGNEEYLSYWAKNNKKLFHLLGGNLIYKIPFKYEKPSEEIRHDFEKLFLDEKGFYQKIKKEISTKIKAEITNSKEEMTGWEISNLTFDIFCNFSVDCFTRQNTYKIVKYKSPSAKRTLQIQAGGKPLRAFQNTVKYFFGDTYDKELEQFQIKVSQIYNEKTINGNLCLSIHPLDYMTMSDNASDWKSCMSWKDEGCYSVGTVEMMNSNNVIVAYLEASTPMAFTYEGKEYTWNNKKWRQLFYCTKEIMVSGKAYPYQNYNISRAILDILRNLAKENWNYSYKYGIEQYEDMKYIETTPKMERMKNSRYYNKYNKHTILFDTKGMYNDMFADKSTIYWCIRNKVDRPTTISYSGPTHCLCCNEPTIWINDDNWEYEYSDRYSNTSGSLCPKCEDVIESHTCCKCGKFSMDNVLTFQGDLYCGDCLAKMVKCPDCDNYFYPSSSKIFYAKIKIGEGEKDFTFKPYYLCSNCRVHNAKNFPLTRVSDFDYFIEKNELAFMENVSKKIYNPDDEEIIKHSEESLERIKPDF